MIDMVGPEDLLHRLMFRVMQARRDGLDDAAGYDHAGVAVLSMTVATTLTVPQRFAAMRALFVLGSCLPLTSALRAPLSSAIVANGIDVAPDLPGDDPLKLSLSNNHLLMQAALLLRWPEIDTGRATAEALTRQFLAQMTDTGLFPSELCRGASCLWYANMAVMLLTTIAFSTRNLEASIVPSDVLAKTIDGLAYALTFPPEVRALARRNLYSHPDHGHDVNAPDRRFLTGYHRSRHYLAWVPLASHLLERPVLPIMISEDDQFPLCCDFIGGFSDHFLRDITDT